MLNQRRHIVNDNAFPVGLAGSHEPCMMLALGLIELMIFKRLEVQRSCEVEGVVRDRALRRARGRADEASLKVGNLPEPPHFSREDCRFIGCKVFAKPEEGTVDEHLGLS